jgi:hypothetical protein
MPTAVDLLIVELGERAGHLGPTPPFVRQRRGHTLTRISQEGPV